jgi:O-antigen/teichoic acid export membrane protein
MKLNSLTTICQAVVKTVAGPVLVLLGFGVFGAVVSAVVAVAAGGIIGIVIVYFVLFRPLRQAKTGRSEFSRVLKPMLKYGLPLTVSNIVIGVLPLLFGSLMLIYAGESFYGNYMAALNFAVLVTFFTIPISTVLFPTFSKFNPKEEPGLIKTVFASSVKYTSVLVVPATMAIMVLSSAAVNTLYGYTATGDPKYVFTPFFLILTLLVNLFCLAGNISMGTFLTGIGETKLLMKQGLLTLAIGLPLALGVVPYLRTFAGGEFVVIVAIAGIFFSGIPSTVWGLYWVWKHFGAKADFRVSAKIFGACSLAAIATLLVLNVISAASDWMKLLVGLVVFVVLYLTAAPLVGAVNQTDVNNFRAMFSGLGIVSALLEIPLKFVEVPLKLRRNRTET